jgi:SET domain-containing protein
MHCRKSKKLLSRVFVDTPECCPYCYKDSGVHGLGVFAKKNLPKNFNLGKFLINKSGSEFPAVFYRDELCRFMNHSNQNNISLKYKDGVFYAVTNRDIESGSEIFSNYKNILDTLGKDFLPFIIDKPIIIRTKALKSHGSSSHGDAYDDLGKIINGIWK